MDWNVECESLGDVGTLVGKVYLRCAGWLWQRLQACQSILPGSGAEGGPHIFNTDSAILETQEPRKDLPCTATPVKPTLGFDLKFHAGYEVSIPLKELVGEQNLLTMIYRVTPENHKDEPVYMSQRVHVPEIDDNAHGDAYLQGSFDVGEGKYHVDWLMRDRTERVCSAFWDIDASLTPKDKPVALEIRPEHRIEHRYGAFQRRAAHRKGATGRRAERQSNYELRAAGLCGGGFASPGHQRSDFHSARYRARAAHRQVLDCRLQPSVAAGGVPAGRFNANRFPGVG